MPETSSVVRATVDGVDYDLDFSDLNAIDAKDFRREVGIPIASVLTGGVDADLDVIAGLVWLARRKNEPSLTYTAVAESISFTSDLDLNAVEEAEPDPET